MEGGREEGCVHIKNVDEDGGVVRMRVGRLVCLKEEMRWRREAALAGAQWQRSLQRGGREKARGRVLNLPVKRCIRTPHACSHSLSFSVDNRNQSYDEDEDENDDNDGFSIKKWDKKKLSRLKKMIKRIKADYPPHL